MGAPTVTLAEAARRSPLSVATLRRWLADGKIPGAERTNEGAWAIPIPDLVEAGAWPSTTPPEADEPPDTDTEALAEALAQRDHARAELDTERRLREAAERNADDLRTALRMLDAGPPSSSPPSTPGRPPWYQRVLDREAAQRERRTPPPWEH
jgi:hypothetical protein